MEPQILRIGVLAAAAVGCASLVVGGVHDVGLRAPVGFLSVDEALSVWQLLADICLAVAALAFAACAVRADRGRMALALASLATALLLIGEAAPLGSRANVAVAAVIGACALAAMATGIRRVLPPGSGLPLLVVTAMLVVAFALDVVTPKRLDGWGRSTRPVVAEAVVEETLESSASVAVGAVALSVLVAAGARRRRVAPSVTGRPGVEGG